MASERYRRNNIASLTLQDGTVAEDHASKESVIFHSFKERLGTSSKHEMKFNLASIIKRIDGLDALTVPFTRQEIDLVIKEMPADRAPGPDGFNGSFLKSGWHIIKEDFYALCDQFFDGGLNLESINDGYITLIPKVSTPQGVNDFRPITLLNCCLKVITKLLANRLQKVILKIIHRNQYGFLKKRSIQDCLAWAFEYIYQCQNSKQPIVLLKLDFAKAFDTIEHEAMIEIMKNMGFNDKWFGWIKDIFSSVGLKINFHKSTLVPLNYDAATAQHIAQIFGCVIGKLPFTYLGLPMGTSKPTVQDLMPLVCGVERRLSSTLSMISYGGKLSLLNSVITSLIIFALCTLKLLYSHWDVPWVELIWSTYYVDKIPHASDPCGSFWWKDILKLTPTYRGISHVVVHSGNMVLMWKDLWLDEVLAESHPRAFSYAKLEDISVRNLVGSQNLNETFHLPLSMQAHDELRHIQEITAHVGNQVDEVERDQWCYAWGTDVYTAKSYYKFYFRDVSTHKAYKWLWKSSATMKIKVFGWLLLSDRLDTRNMLKRRHYKIGDNYGCILCGTNDEETLEHMIFHCPFSKACWDTLHIHWATQGDRLFWIQEAKTAWNNPMFMEIFLYASWSLWKEKNNKHFRSIAPSISSWATRFKEDFSLLTHRAKERHRGFVPSFLEYFVHP
ncbi:uncharacterized protein LOC119299287 [Triticum dicoccoides]|uniref:uncharacterized protein LOC119299287 n=1 Tax=Triticum dicoccoides TaxID=85692 RepID=UPI00188F92F4|nr:uncharacterized protein LOC119299287 [Triticum dicoccoides]